MALQPQVVPVSLGRLDSKIDEHDLPIGDMAVLENVRFDTPGKLLKRYGFDTVLGQVPAGSLLAPFKQQLLVGSGTEAYSLAAGSSSLVDKGVLESMSLSALPVRRDAYMQTTPDSAVHPGGITVYTWETSAGGSQYAIFDSTTGQPVVSGQQLGTAASRPKPFALGPYVVIIFYEASLTHLQYIAIQASTLATTAPTDLATDPSTLNVWDATVVGGVASGSLVLTYLNNAGSNKITLKYLTAGLVLSAATVPVTTETYQTCVAIFGDTSNQVWVAYYSSSNTLAFFVYDFTLSNLLQGFTLVDPSPGTVRNLAGISVGSSAAMLFYESSTPSITKYAAITSDGISPTTGTIARSVGLASKPFIYLGRVHVLTAYQSPLQSTYFLFGVTAPHITDSTSAGVSIGDTQVPLSHNHGFAAGDVVQIDTGGNLETFTVASVGTGGGAGLPQILFSAMPLAKNHSIGQPVTARRRTTGIDDGSFANPKGSVIGKLAAGLGGGLTARSILPEACAIGPGVFSATYLQADQLSSVGGNVFTQAGVMAASFDFTQLQTAVELSDNLHLAGGVLSMYDGAAVVEHGFHLYPEPLGASASGSGSFTGSYLICAVYEWMDNYGLIHQSSPSPVVTVVASSAAQFNLSSPTLRLTSKVTPIAVVFYRTIANQTGPFYRVTSISNPVLNSTTTDSVNTIDTTSDASITGNAQLVMNPVNASAELPNLAAPAVNHVWRYRNRVAAIPSENPYQWIFSKAFVPGVPIEFNDQNLYQPVAQDGGPLTCGIEMDEKNILFTSTRIYFVVGDGPAANGTSPDYGSSPQNIPTDVGCTNRRSVVLTPLGVMFQATSGGIYLLTRGLTVEYIGAPVEAFNGASVTAAKMPPTSGGKARRVVFTLSSGVALVFDFQAGKWSVWRNVNAADAAIFQGLLAYVQPGGAVLQETPGDWSDNGSPVLVGLTTGWISFAGLEGFQRVWRFNLLGDYRSPHKLAVSVAVNSNPIPVQTETVDAGSLLGAGAVGDTTLADTDSPGDGAFPGYEMVVKLLRQKCTNIQITIRESQVGPSYGEGFAIHALTFSAGVKRGLHKLPVAKAI
jgi:hypothetical protein